jgi:hypothetical protein
LKSVHFDDYREGGTLLLLRWVVESLEVGSR